MGPEWLRRRATCDRLQHRRFDFEKASRLHETADFANDRDPFFEDAARLLVRQQIEIALAITRLYVLQVRAIFREADAAIFASTSSV